MTFDSNRRFTPWLFSIAHRTAIDTSRRRKVRQAAVLNDQITESPAPALKGVETQHDVQSVVQTLDRRCRRYFELWQKSGGQMTLDEAALQLGVSRSTAFNVKRQILAALETAFAE